MYGEQCFYKQSPCSEILRGGTAENMTNAKNAHKMLFWTEVHVLDTTQKLHGQWPCQSLKELMSKTEW